MANQIAKLSNIGNILGLKGREFTFQDPALISAPNTTITDLYGSFRKISDPSKTLRPSLGVERIRTTNISLVADEKGPSGELVWEINSKDDRVRFVGNWISDSSTNGSNILASSGTSGDYVEVTFYGTGLNLLFFVTSFTTYDLRVSVDGGAEGSNIMIATSGSTILQGRNYPTNQVLPVVSGLTLGTHTVKIRNAVLTGTNHRVYGFEILNQSTQIKTPQGEVFYAGRKYTNPSIISSDYNSGFDGSPVLNGRGGRVVEYITRSGIIGKVIQQTDSAAAYLSSANHSNEEKIKKVNFREFGASRSDDFSTFVASGLDSNAFTLDDGTTSLTCLSGNIAGSNAPSVWPGTTGAYVMVTFVGTGLDIVRSDSGNGTLDSHTILIDGANVGTISSAASTTQRIEKIVSGLPYGSHTVQILRPSAVNNALGVADFIIYGPKKPSIPEESSQIIEYYLMADFSAAGVAGVAAADNADMYQGVLYKATTREMIYVGTWSAPVLDNNFFIPGGFYPNTTTNASYMEYTFWGTGIGIQFIDSAAGTVTYSITVDGVANASGNNLISVTNNGAGSYTTNTAVGGRPARLTFTGLSLDKHTIRITRNGGSGGMAPVSLFIITPVHFPGTKTGSMSMGPCPQFNKDASGSNVDLSKAKAWLVYNSTSQTILNSYNIAGVLSVSSSTTRIFFERSFKDKHYVAVGMSSHPETWTSLEVNNSKTPDSFILLTSNSAGTGGATEYVAVVFFGELADEVNE